MHGVARVVSSKCRGYRRVCWTCWGQVLGLPLNKRVVVPNALFATICIIWDLNGNLKREV